MRGLIAAAVSLLFTGSFVFLLYQEWALRSYLRARALTFRLLGFIAIGIPLFLRQVRILVSGPESRQLYGWDYAIAVITFFASWIFVIFLIIGNHMLKRYLDGIESSMKDHGDR